VSFDEKNTHLSDASAFSARGKFKTISHSCIGLVIAGCVFKKLREQQPAMCSQRCVEGRRGRELVMSKIKRGLDLRRYNGCSENT